MPNMNNIDAIIAELGRAIDRGWANAAHLSEIRDALEQVNEKLKELARHD